MSVEALETVEVVRLAREGNHEATGELFARTHRTLRDIAGRERGRWQGNLTVNATALVNEACLKLMGGRSLEINDRAHFLAVASRAMRQVLQDYAKGQRADKRGGAVKRVSLEPDLHANAADEHVMPVDEIDLSRALARLEERYPELVPVVECRFLGGMTIKETAEALGVGTATVKRRWSLAQTLLYGFFRDGE